MVLPITLRQLEYFVSAAQAGSMTKAATEQYVSQSAISLAIGDLERAVGTQLLLRRRGRGLSLTAAGRHMLADARDLLGRAGDLVNETRTLGEDLQGTLAVACYDTIAPFLVPRLLTTFGERYPDLTVDLHGGNMADLHTQVSDGRCEMFISYDLDLAADIETVLLQPTAPYVLLGEGHHLAEQPEISLETLVGESLVLLDHPQPSHYFLSLFQTANLQPTIGYRTTSFELVRSLVARGHGYSLLIQRPSSDVSYEGIGLVCRQLHQPTQTLNIVIGTPAGARLTRRATAFISHCVEQLGPDGHR